MKVYVDVTRTLKTTFVSGIQRAVFEFGSRLVKCKEFETVLIYKQDATGYRVVDNYAFCKCYEVGQMDRSNCITKKLLHYNKFSNKDIFLILDAWWGLEEFQEQLLVKLKHRGVNIITYIYDIIAITEPQFMDNNIIDNFVPFAVTQFTYSDLLLCSTNFTISQIHDVCAKYKIPETNYGVVPLGVDLNENNQGSVREDVAQLISSQRKYIIFVSTIEPRKNHKLLLDALDNGLSDLGIAVVFVGRNGWKNKMTMDRIAHHPLKNNLLFHFQGLNDKSLHELYNHAFLAAYPSFIEGFGMPAIEGMFHGIPTIHSDVPVLHEIIGEFGDYVNPNDPQEFVEHVKRYLNEKFYSERKERVRTYHPCSWDEATSRLAEYIVKMGESEGRSLANIVDNKIDVKKIISEIKLEIDEKKSVTSAYTVNADNTRKLEKDKRESLIMNNIKLLNNEINYLQAHEINYYHELSSYHKGFTAIIVFIKRVIRKCCKFFVRPIVDEINEYHIHLTKTLEYTLNTLNYLSMDDTMKPTELQLIDEHKYKKLAEQYETSNYYMIQQIQTLQHDVEILQKQLKQVSSRNGEL